MHTRACRAQNVRFDKKASKRVIFMARECCMVGSPLALSSLMRITLDVWHIQCDFHFFACRDVQHLLNAFLARKLPHLLFISERNIASHSTKLDTNRPLGILHRHTSILLGFCVIPGSRYLADRVTASSLKSGALGQIEKVKKIMNFAEKTHNDWAYVGDLNASKRHAGTCLGRPTPADNVKSPVSVRLLVYSSL